MTTTSYSLAIPAHGNGEMSLPEKVDYAKFLAKADLLPKAYQDKPANLLYAIEYGAMLGLPPIAAVVGIHVIDGRPTMGAGLMAAKVRQAGHQIRVQSTGAGDDAKARCTITRKDDPGFTYSATWDMDRAKQAGLLGKTNWRQHPVQMLKNRAISECCRDACQEVLLGVHYTPDELGGDDDGPEVISDGYPTLADGRLDASAMSEHDKEAAGLMDRGQRIAHEQLVRQNQVDPAKIDHQHAPDDSDPWATPGTRPKPAPPKTLLALEELTKSLQLGPDDDVRAVYEWLAGSEWQATIAQCRRVNQALTSFVAAADGDLDAARDAIWERYREQHPPEGGDAL